MVGALALIALAGCTSAPKPRARIEAPPQAEKPVAAPVVRGGGYYQDDGPGESPPPNLEAIPDAEPKPEPLHKFANRPYTALGNFFPYQEATPRA